MTRVTSLGVVAELIRKEGMNLLVCIVDHFDEGIVAFIENAVGHHRLFIVLEVKLKFKPEEVLYQKVIEWL
jgi:hypothetical protein